MLALAACLVQGQLSYSEGCSSYGCNSDTQRASPSPTAAPSPSPTIVEATPHQTEFQGDLLAYVPRVIDNSYSKYFFMAPEYRPAVAVPKLPDFTLPELPLESKFLKVTNEIEKTFLSFSMAPVGIQICSMLNRETLAHKALRGAIALGVTKSLGGDASVTSPFLTKVDWCNDSNSGTVTFSGRHLADSGVGMSIELPGLAGARARKNAEKIKNALKRQEANGILDIAIKNEMASHGVLTIAIASGKTAIDEGSFKIETRVVERDAYMEKSTGETGMTGGEVATVVIFLLLFFAGSYYYNRQQQQKKKQVFGQRNLALQQVQVKPAPPTKIKSDDVTRMLDRNRSRRKREEEEDSQLSLSPAKHKLMYDRATASPGMPIESDAEYHARMAEKQRLESVQKWEQSWAWEFDVSPAQPRRPQSRARPRTSPFATGAADSRFKCFTIALATALYYTNYVMDFAVLSYYYEFGHDYKKVNKADYLAFEMTVLAIVFHPCAIAMLNAYRGPLPFIRSLLLADCGHEALRSLTRGQVTMEYARVRLYHTITQLMPMAILQLSTLLLWWDNWTVGEVNYNNPAGSVERGRSLKALFAISVLCHCAGATVALAEHLENFDPDLFTYKAVSHAISKSTETAKAKARAIALANPDEPSPDQSNGPACVGASARMALYVYAASDVTIHVLVMAAFWVQREGALLGMMVEIWLTRLLVFMGFELFLIDRKEWALEFLITNFGLALFFGAPQVVLDIPLTENFGSQPLQLQLLLSLIEGLAMTLTSCLAAQRPLPVSLGCACVAEVYDIRRNNITCIPHMRDNPSNPNEQLGDVGDAPAYHMSLITVVVVIWVLKLAMFCRLNGMASRSSYSSPASLPRTLPFDPPLPRTMSCGRSRGHSRGGSREVRGGQQLDLFFGRNDNPTRPKSGSRGGAGGAKVYSVTYDDE